MLIESDKFLEFLDNLIEQAQANVYDYEEFYEDRIADIRKMQPMDAFLYGVATGKLQQVEYFKQLVESGEDLYGK
jgi:hypothetical protein